jgi:hypothetical protein
MIYDERTPIYRPAMRGFPLDVINARMLDRVQRQVGVLVGDHPVEPRQPHEIRPEGTALRATPKVRTNAVRNKEQAARLQALVDLKVSGKSMQAWREKPGIFGVRVDGHDEVFTVTYVTNNAYGGKPGVLYYELAERPGEMFNASRCEIVK